MHVRTTDRAMMYKQRISKSSILEVVYHRNKVGPQSFNRKCVPCECGVRHREESSRNPMGCPRPTALMPVSVRKRTHFTGLPGFCRIRSNFTLNLKYFQG